MATNTGLGDAERDQARPDVTEQPAVEDWEIDWFAPEPQQPFWASFNRDDAKVFWITFAGTVTGTMTIARQGRALIIVLCPV